MNDLILSHLRTVAHLPWEVRANGTIRYRHKRGWFRRDWWICPVCAIANLAVGEVRWSHNASAAYVAARLSGRYAEYGPVICASDIPEDYRRPALMAALEMTK